MGLHGVGHDWVTEHIALSRTLKDMDGAQLP